jgi:hypothetical protein
MVLSMASFGIIYGEFKPLKCCLSVHKAVHTIAQTGNFSHCNKLNTRMIAPYSYLHTVSLHKAVLSMARNGIIYGERVQIKALKNRVLINITRQSKYFTALLATIKQAQVLSMASKSIIYGEQRYYLWRIKVLSMANAWYYSWRVLNRK